MNTGKKLIVVLFFLVFSSFKIASENISFVTFNVWSGLDYNGFFKCKELEPPNDKSFRQTIILSGLKKLNSDIICLNGINPAKDISKEIALFLDLNYEYHISRSGARIASVSLPINLREGDGLFFNKDFLIEPCGILKMNSLLSKSGISFLSKNGVQVFGEKVITSESEFYVFSVHWTKSPLDDTSSLTNMVDLYTKGEMEPFAFSEMIDQAVEGAIKRKEQAEETLSFINSKTGELPVVIMGSLNALPESDEMKIIKNSGFIDVFDKAGKSNGFTIESSGMKYRLDYILVRGKGVVPLSAERVMDEPVYGVYPSKRYGVSAVIKFPPNLSSQ